MKNSNIAVLGAGLAGLSLNASVGMDDVISVFITKYEDQQISDRQFLQKEMIELNKVIKGLVDSATAVAQAGVARYEVTEDNGMFVVQVKVRSDNPVSLDWNKGVAQVILLSTVTSKSVVGYQSEVSGTMKAEVALNGSDTERYHELMARKTDLTEKLNQVQANLRDVSRKERQVRGKLAELKLGEEGMEALLTNTNLLALVNESVLKG